MAPGARLVPCVADRQPHPCGHKASDTEIEADALQAIPRVGPWTARAAAADWSNDWALYPYTDLAVRTWAKRAAPSRYWPVDEPTFGRMWRALAGEGLSSLDS